jgi:putative ABC transport system permease protein
MMPALWFRFAARELRSGLRAFWIFLICLTLGTSSIAMIGSLSSAISRGLSEQGQSLLGGDADFSLIHREATPAEMAFLTSQGEVGVVAAMRAMAVAPQATTLVEVKAVDATYPLYGTLALNDKGAFPAAIAKGPESFGAVVDPLLLGRLGLKLGDSMRIGTAAIKITGTITTEPDRISDGFILGPRVLLSRETLAATGLVQPGSLVTYHYRVKLPEGTSPAALQAMVGTAEKQFPDAGWQVRTRDKAAQGTENFVSRLSYFMTLVGLTALIVGGAGIANAVSAFVERRVETIATLKCLGAPGRDIFAICLTEIILVALLGLAISVALGALTPLVAHALLTGILPLPLTTTVEWRPLALTLVLGLLVTLAFSIWPLARTRKIAPATLFRARSTPAAGWPARGFVLATALCFLAIAMVILLAFDARRVTLYYLLGLSASFVILLGLAALIVKAAQLLPKPRSVVWRYAIANIYRPGAAAMSVILALGLGLTLFVTLALTDRSISAELQAGLPKQAPAFFFLDVRNDELAGFKATVQKFPGVTAVDNAPMLRGRIVKIGGAPVSEVKAQGDGGWALRGDRGLTYAETLPAGSTLVEGQWWDKDYAGPPLVSFVDEVAHGIGLKLGDSVTVNVLGRNVTAKVANFRQVNWRSMGINFVMVFSPNTLKNAPHSHIVTVNMSGGDEAALLNETARAFPSVTAVRVKEALATISDLLGKMLAAIRGANLLTLATGVLVLSGALASGLASRTYEAVVLKTYGATRRQLIAAFVIEYALLGLAAALFGIVVGALASLFLARFVLEMPWSFAPAVAIITGLATMMLTVAVGLLVTWRALSTKPAPLLRNE